MAKAKVRVELTDKEITEALVAMADKTVGSNGGGAIVELFDEKDMPIHAKVCFVEFQFVKK